MSIKNQTTDIFRSDTFRAQVAQELAQERFALKLTSRLSDSAETLPHDIEERLRVSRQQAVAKRKLASLTRLATASSVSRSGGAATMTMNGRGSEPFSLWNAVASALPLVALMVGLVVINNIQNDLRASEVAEVDAALLTDDLPPSAYTDPGFAQFLKSRSDLGQ